MTSLDYGKTNHPMSLINSWEPLTRDFDRMFRDMGHLMAPFRKMTGEGLEYLPPCDIHESETEYHLIMDMPGVDKENIQVDVVGNAVTISGRRSDVLEADMGKFSRKERSFGAFSRAFTLPEGVVADAIEASYDLGTLCLTLQKSEKSVPKRIEVKVEKPKFIANSGKKSKMS